MLSLRDEFSFSAMFDGHTALAGIVGGNGIIISSIALYDDNSKSISYTPGMLDKAVFTPAGRDEIYITCSISGGGIAKKAVMNIRTVRNYFNLDSSFITIGSEWRSMTTGNRFYISSIEGYENITIRNKKHTATTKASSLIINNVRVTGNIFNNLFKKSTVRK